MSAGDWGVVKAKEVEIPERLIFRILQIARAFSIHISWQLCLPNLFLDSQKLLPAILESDTSLLGNRDELIWDCLLHVHDIFAWQEIVRHLWYQDW